MDSDGVERLLHERLARAHGGQSTALRRSAWRAMDDRYLSRLAVEVPTEATRAGVAAYVRQRQRLQALGSNSASWTPGRWRPRIGLAKRETAVQYLGFVVALLVCPPPLLRARLRHDLQHAAAGH